MKTCFSVKDWEEMRRRNATAEYESSLSCASHDFCDANMIMDAAWRAAFGEAPLLVCDGASEQAVAAQVAIWNAAWSRAKAEYLTAKADTRANA